MKITTDIDSTSRSRLGSVFITLSFIIFLIPFSFDMGGDGLSGNYSFFLFPIFIWLLSHKIYSPDQDTTIVIFIYVLIFIVSTVYQYQYYQFADRRLVSFIIFLSIFLFLSIKIDSNMILCFKLALIFVSILFSVLTISNFYSLGGNDLGFSAKGDVGSQRYGFVYIMALWVIFYYNPINKLFQPLKYAAFLIIVVGLMLTFSRSGIISLLGSFLIYAMNRFANNKVNIKTIASFIILAIASILGYLIILRLFPVVFDFFGERLFSLETSSGASTYNFEDTESSEGWRLYMMKIIGEFILLNPFTGSGFLGSWILFDDLSGSAHNQFLDVLFRTGIIGFVIYLWLLYRLLRFLKLNDPSLFWGFTGVLIYGLFHETFKLSQGSFILSFMIGMMMQKNLSASCHVHHTALNDQGS